RNTGGIYTKFSSSSMSHDLLECIRQHVAIWNSSRAKNCQCGAAQYGSRQCDERTGAFSHLNQPDFASNRLKFVAGNCRQKHFRWPAPQIVNDNLKTGLARLLNKRLRNLLFRSIKLDRAVSAEFGQRVQDLLIPSRGNNPRGAKEFGGHYR